jgi:hypothetical protein
LADGLDVEWPGRGEVIESVSSMYG